MVEQVPQYDHHLRCICYAVVEYGKCALDTLSIQRKHGLGLSIRVFPQPVHKTTTKAYTEFIDIANTHKYTADSPSSSSSKDMVYEIHNPSAFAYLQTSGVIHV